MADFRAPGPFAVTVQDGEWLDGRRQRLLRWRHYQPEDCRKALVLYSHGLGGSRESGAHWLRHWASWGIGAIALQHPGTDADALAGQSQLAMRHLLRRAADPAELDLRQHDLLFALDRIATTHQVAMSIAGHSYGAVSAMRLIGERRGRNDLPADTRLRAAVLFSPSARGGHLPLDERFGGIAIPTLHLTGTEDHGIGPGDIDASARCQPFQHGPAHLCSLLVLSGVTHADLAGDQGNNARATCLLRASTTAYLLCHLAAEEPAERWLQENLPAALEADDRLKSPFATH